jgi:hypothetical protein
LRITNEPVVSCALNNAGALLAEQVLINFNKLFVGNKCKTLFADLIKVTAKDERSFGDSPQSEMRLFLLEG